MDTDYNIIASFSRDGDEPITQAEAKNYIKQDNDVAAENTLVDQLIVNAVGQAEQITNKQMNTELGITMYIDIEEADSNGAYIIELPYINSSITIESIEAIDYEGDSVVVSSSDYELRGNILRLKMTNLEGYRFTVVTTNTITTAQQEQFKTALLALVSYKYMNRADEKAGAATRLLSSHIDQTNWI